MVKEISCVSLGLAAALVVACGGQARAPEAQELCQTVEGMRPQILEAEREELDSSDWTRQRPAEQKRQAVEAIASEIVAACTAERWSKATVDCFVTEQCSNRSDRELVQHAFRDAEHRVLTRLFGPRPPNELDK